MIELSDETDDCFRDSKGIYSACSPNIIRMKAARSILNNKLNQYFIFMVQILSISISIICRKFAVRSASENFILNNVIGFGLHFHFIIIFNYVCTTGILLLCV